MGAGKSLQGLNPSRHHWLLRCDQRKTRFHKPANEGAVCLLVLGWNSITAVYYRIGSHMPNVTAHPLWGFLPLHFRFERGTMDEAMYESQHRSHPLHPFPPAIMMLSLSLSLPALPPTKARGRAHAGVGTAQQWHPIVDVRTTADGA